ncbi:MAG: hypothetical protein QM776_04770 [Rhodocyclaceae bacterium]
MVMAEWRVMSIEEAMDSRRIRSLDPSVKLLWGDQTMQDVAERAPQDRYSDFSTNNFPYQQGACFSAFVGVVRKIVKEAREYGFDQAWFQAAPVKGVPSPGKNEFLCDNGFRSSDVVLLVTFGLSQSGQAMQQVLRNDPARAAEIELRVAQRKAGGKTIFLPMASLLESPEAQKMLRPGERLFWGNKPVPAFSLRKGPDRHSEDASYKEFGQDGACQAAGLKALAEILKDMRELGFNAAVRIHSKLNGFPALDDEYECQPDRSSAEVSLYATLARIE